MPSPEEEPAAFDFSSVEREFVIDFDAMQERDLQIYIIGSVKKVYNELSSPEDGTEPQRTLRTYAPPDGQNRGYAFVISPTNQHSSDTYLYIDSLYYGSYDATSPSEPDKSRIMLPVNQQDRISMSELSVMFTGSVHEELVGLATVFNNILTNQRNGEDGMLRARFKNLAATKEDASNPSFIGDVAVGKAIRRLKEEGTRSKDAKYKALNLFHSVGEMVYTAELVKFNTQDIEFISMCCTLNGKVLDSLEVDFTDDGRETVELENPMYWNQGMIEEILSDGIAVTEDITVD